MNTPGISILTWTLSNQMEEFEQKHAKTAKAAAANTPQPQHFISRIQNLGIFAAGAMISSFAIFASFCSKLFSSSPTP